MIRLHSALTVAAALLPSLALAGPTTVNVDEYRVFRDGIQIFDDSFNSSTALVGGSGTLVPASVGFTNPTAVADYFVRGTIPQTTANSGQATLNTANGVVISQPAPFLSSIQLTSSFLQTGTSPTGIRSLTPTTGFTVQGLFDTAVPTTPLGTYDITLTNRVTANAQMANQLELRVRDCVAGQGLCGTLSGPVLQFFWGDFANNTEALITQGAISGAAQADPQLLLEFTKSGGSDAITAEAEFGTGNTISGFVANHVIVLGTTDATTDVFTAADQFVLPGFEAFDPVTAAVPEPSSLLVLIGGLVGLVVAKRR
jgi:hypothetical protein